MQTNKTCREKSQSNLGRKSGGVCFGCGNSLETATEMCCIAKENRESSSNKFLAGKPCSAWPWDSSSPAQCTSCTRCEVNFLCMFPHHLGTCPTSTRHRSSGCHAATPARAAGAHQQCFPRAGWCNSPQLLFSFSDFQWGAQMGYSVSAESNKR